MKNNYQTVAMIVIAGVLGYFIGMNFPINKQTTAETSPFTNQRMVGRNGQNNQAAVGGSTVRGNTTRNNTQRGGMMGARPISGEIIALDDKSMTIKLTNSTSKIVLFDTGMIVNKMATGTATDLKVGGKVAAFGKENADGSMTAQNVQLDPQFQMNRNGTGTPAPTNGN